jgi:hypothetical protein
MSQALRLQLYNDLLNWPLTWKGRTSVYSEEGVKIDLLTPISPHDSLGTFGHLHVRSPRDHSNSAVIVKIESNEEDTSSPLSSAGSSAHVLPHTHKASFEKPIPKQKSLHAAEFLEPGTLHRPCSGQAEKKMRKKEGEACQPKSPGQEYSEL